jgi:hypothetical protein
MANDLVVPEIVLLDKLEEMDNALSPTLWAQMRNDAVCFEETLDRKDKNLPAIQRAKKRMFLQDFANKAINEMIEISPMVTPEIAKQIYRLHIFCCQRVLHDADVRHNPLTLSFKALGEMKNALIGIFLSYRLIEPSCPYSWDKDFFERNIFLHKNSEGGVVLTFSKIDTDTINKAVNEEVVTDWLIYRAYDHNGIRTLMDIKNNLLTLPNYLRGGHPSVEFSRFERKFREKVNKKKEARNDALDLEYRKTLVRAIAEERVQRMIDQGMSAEEMLAAAYSDNLSLEERPNQSLPQKQSAAPKRITSAPKALPRSDSTPETSAIDEMIAKFLDDE